MKRFFLFLFSFIFLNTCSYAFAKDNEEAAVTNAHLGLAYLNKGLYSVSKSRLLNAIQDDPNIAISWYSMAYYLEKTSDNVDAEQDYLKAIAVSPHSGAAKNNYGAFLCRMKQYQKGMAELVAAANEPSYLNVGEAYENAGICALMAKNQSLAMKYFQMAYNNNPSLPFTLLSLARLSYEKNNTVDANRYLTYLEKSQSLEKNSKQLVQYRDYVFRPVGK